MTKVASARLSGVGTTLLGRSEAWCFEAGSGPIARLGRLKERE